MATHTVVLIHQLLATEVLNRMEREAYDTEKAQRRRWNHARSTANVYDRRRMNRGHTVQGRR